MYDLVKKTVTAFEPNGDVVQREIFNSKGARVMLEIRTPDEVAGFPHVVIKRFNDNGDAFVIRHFQKIQLKHEDTLLAEITLGGPSDSIFVSMEIKPIARPASTFFQNTESKEQYMDLVRLMNSVREGDF